MFKYKPFVGCFKEFKEKDKDFLENLTIIIEKSVGKKEFKPETIFLYKILGKYLIVPRFFPQNYENLGKKDQLETISFNFDINFFDKNQEIVYNATLKQIKEKGGCTLVLKPGRGKSFITGKIIENLGKKTLIICHTKEIALYWKKEVFKEKATEFMGKTKKKSNLTVGTIQTILKQPLEFFFDFDFIVFDEITEMTSEKRRDIFWKSSFYVLALTGTPYLKKKKKKIFELHCGKLLFAENLENYCEDSIKWNGKVLAIHYFGSEEYTKQILSSIGYVSAIEMTKQFAQDEERTNLIMKHIENLIKEGKNIYVFCSLCSFAKKLYEKLDFENKAVLMGSEKTCEIEEIISKKQVVFTTYSFASKGISIPKMDAIVLAQPKKSDGEQIIGRILRIGGNLSNERIIVDIIDANTSIKSQYYERKKVYLKLNFVIEKIIVKI